MTIVLIDLPMSNPGVFRAYVRPRTNLCCAFGLIPGCQCAYKRRLLRQEGQYVEEEACGVHAEADSLIRQPLKPSETQLFHHLIKVPLGLSTRILFSLLQ